MRKQIFTIPTPLGVGPGKPNVRVVMYEKPDGSIGFDVTVDGNTTDDLRGFFFDLASSPVVSKLVVASGPQVLGSSFADEGVTGFAPSTGVSMASTGSVFDGGLLFRSTPGTSGGVFTTSFSLARNDAVPLTLDDFSKVDFGVQIGNVGTKAVTRVTSAPDAKDDAFTIFEDAARTTFAVLGNDTDADGDPLRVTTPIQGPNGVVRVSNDGKGVQFTPNAGWSGDELITYTVIDGKGGSDTATLQVHVEAVADTPNLTVTLSADPSDPLNPNKIIVHVTASVTDTDGSEYIDRIQFSGLPPGASIVGVPTNVDDPAIPPFAIGPGTYTKDYVLTLASGTDFNFDLGVKAYAKERSNGSEASATIAKHVEVDANHTDVSLTFHAQDQSIWGSGAAFQFTDDRFLGIDVSGPAGIHQGFDIGLVNGSFDAELKLGFQSTLHFNGGNIDASLPVAFAVDTTYNKTIDTLLIVSSATILPGGTFSTIGPEGSYSLDFIFNYLLGLDVNYDVVVDSGDLFNFNISGNHTTNIIDLDSADAAVTIPLPAGLSIDLAWPHLATNGNIPPGTSSGASNNILQLNVDVDRLAATVLGFPDPFEISVDLGIVKGTLELADLDLSGGINFLQTFELLVSGMGGLLLFEDGANQAFVFGSNVAVAAASAHDANNDGKIDFSVLQLDPDATLHNDTDLGFNVGYSFDLVKFNGSYDVVVDSGSLNFGPLFHSDGNATVATVGVYDNTFALDFQNQGFGFST